jgi:hypothetical protein
MESRVDDLKQIIVSYSIGDGYTWSGTEIKPALATSIEAFLEDFELKLMTEIECPTDAKTFVCGSQEFHFCDFLYTREIKRPHTVKHVTEYDLPEVLPLDVWFGRNIKVGPPSPVEEGSAPSP